MRVFRLALLLMASTLWAEPEPNSQHLYLTLQDCIARALDNNLEIAIERLNPQISEMAIRQSKGEFDPTLVLRPNYEESKTPLNAQNSVASGGLTSTQSRTTSFDTAIQGKIPLGTSYDIGLRTTDAQNTFNSFKDQYSTFWGLSVTQPLLKGFGTDNQLAVLRIARKQKQISDEDFELKVVDVVSRTIGAYYNLAFAIENRKVQIQALELAAKLLEDNRKRVSIGVMPPLEVTQAESGVAGREEDVIVADQEVKTRMNELRLLISQNVSEIQSHLLFPVETILEAPAPSLNLEEAISTALLHRPEYDRAKLAVEQQHIQLAYDQNQRFPQIDLTSSYGFNGIGSDFAKSVNTDADQWSVGFNIRVPLPDQAGEARVGKSKLEKERLLLQLKQIEQTILVEVDNSLENVQNSYKRIGATRAAVKAAEQALQAENKKLKAGVSTSFTVLELQKELIDTKIRELRALLDYNIALSQFQRAEGTSLQTNRIELVR